MMPIVVSATGVIVCTLDSAICFLMSLASSCLKDVSSLFPLVKAHFTYLVLHSFFTALYQGLILY